MLIVTAGVRATPGVLMVPLEAEFGWSRAAISAAVAINIALFGLIGPFAASAMNRWGLQRLILAAIALLAISVALTTRMEHPLKALPKLPRLPKLPKLKMRVSARRRGKRRCSHSWQSWQFWQ